MKTKHMGDPMKIINEYAGSYRHLITLGRIIAAVSALLTLVPFYDIWKIISIAVKGEDLSGIAPVAWQAVIITVTALLIHIYRGTVMHTYSRIPYTGGYEEQTHAPYHHSPLRRV